MEWLLITPNLIVFTLQTIVLLRRLFFNICLRIPFQLIMVPHLAVLLLAIKELDFNPIYWLFKYTVSLCVCLFTCLPVCVCVRACVYCVLENACVSVCLSVSVCMCISEYMCTMICLSGCQSASSQCVCVWNSEVMCAYVCLYVNYSAMCLYVY